MGQDKAFLEAQEDNPVGARLDWQGVRQETCGSSEVRRNSLPSARWSKMCIRECGPLAGIHAALGGAPNDLSRARRAMQTPNH